MWDAHMFWAYGKLTSLERMCMNSFLANGYSLSLWSYDVIPNAPHRVRLRNAHEIIPEKCVFLNKLGSYASFADWFRYAVLVKHGGLYADTDVIALTTARKLPAAPFLVTERQPGGGVRINNNVIFRPQPSPDDIISRALSRCESTDTSTVEWGEIGPDLLTELVNKHGPLGAAVMPPEFANPLNSWDCPGAALNPKGRLPAGAAFLHLFNEMWRRAGVDKDAPFPKGSVLRIAADRISTRR